MPQAPPTRPRCRLWFRNRGLYFGIRLPDKFPGTFNLRSMNRVRALAILLLTFLFVTNLYRAKTQSITCDEAFSYQSFVSAPLSEMLTTYDASNHVLHTLLAKASITLFGLSEFTLRMPSLLGGLLYFIAVYCLSRLVFGQGGLFLLSVLALSLNPLLLDLLSAARGYGLALAFCMWALFHLVRCLPAFGGSQPSRREALELWRIALLLALSVASNLTFVFVDAGLAGLLLAVLLIDGARTGNLRRNAIRSLKYFIVPGTLVALVILAGPISNATMASFYFGLPSLSETSHSLAALSFSHHPNLWGIAHYRDALSHGVDFVSTALAPAILTLAGLVWFTIVYTWLRSGSLAAHSHEDQFLFLAAGALLFAIGASVVAHRAFGLLYPWGRTGLSWIIFSVLVCLGLAKKFEGKNAFTLAVRLSLLGFLGFCVAWFVLEFNTNHYAEWRYDAGTKRIVTLLRSWHSAEAGTTWRVGVSWLLPSMYFYKTLYGLEWFEPVALQEGVRGLRYFVLVGPDTELVEKMGLRTVYFDPVSTQVLATYPENVRPN